MNKKRSLLIITFLFIVSILFGKTLNVNATMVDGWHFVPATRGSESENYHWAFYENGVEKYRYRKLVSSHRGWMSDYPENSLAAFQAALNNGVLEAETDVRFTMINAENIDDITPVLAHDPAILRYASLKNCSPDNSCEHNRGGGNCIVGASSGYGKCGISKGDREANGDRYIKDHSVSWLNSNYTFNRPTYNTLTGNVSSKDEIDALKECVEPLGAEYNNNGITTFAQAVYFSRDNKNATTGMKLHFAFELKDECDEVQKRHMEKLWKIVTDAYNTDQTGYSGQFTWVCDYPNINPCKYLKQVLVEKNANTIENIVITSDADNPISASEGDTIYNQLKSTKTRVYVTTCNNSECKTVHDETEYFKRLGADLPFYWNQSYLTYSGSTMEVHRYQASDYQKTPRQTITPTVSGVASSYEYTGESIKPNVTVKKGSTPLTLGEDYTVSYGDNKAVGLGTVVIKSVDTSPYSFETITKTFNITGDVDLVLFWGQSNMVGSVGGRTCPNYSESQNVHVDVNKTNLGTEDFSIQTGIYTSIVSRYTTISHVNVPTTNTVFDYSFTDNTIIPITKDTQTIGEDLYCDTGHIASDGSASCASKSEGTNMIPWFGYGYNSRTDRTVVAVHVAKGSLTLNKFLPNDDEHMYEAMKEKFQAAQTYLETKGYTIANKYDVVFQGESNAYSACNQGATTTTWGSNYNRIHESLKNDIDIDFSVVIYTARASGETCNNGVSVYNGVELIHTAQKKVVDENNDVILGTSFPYDHFVPDQANYKGTYPEGQPGGVSQKGMTYAEALERSKMLTAAQCGDSSGYTLHYNAATLSQIGSETAASVDRYLQKETIVPEINGYDVSYVYTGASIKPTITVKIAGTDTSLVEGTDYKVTYGANTNVGIGTITISPLSKSRYTFSEVAAHFQIIPYTLVDNDLHVPDSIIYTGSPLYPRVSVIAAGHILVEGTDYTLTLSNQDGHIGENLVVTVVGKGNYTGTVSKQVPITDKKELIISGVSDNQEITYTGEPVILGGTLIVEENTDGITEWDLDVTWYDENGGVITRPTAVGNYKVVYSYENINYRGSLVIHFSIIEEPKTEYKGGFILDRGVDTIDNYYTNNYSNVDADDVLQALARNADTGAVDVSGNGEIHFRVNVKSGFKIDKISVNGNYDEVLEVVPAEHIYKITKISSDLTITVTTEEKEEIVPEIYGYEPNYEYTGNSIKPSINVRISGTSTLLTKDVDYKVTYGENTNVGTGTITVTTLDSGAYRFSPVVANFNISKYEIKSTDVVVPTQVKYTGNALTPQVVVSAFGNELEKDTDYTVTYTNQNGQVGENVGVEVVGKGNYSGTITKQVAITNSKEELIISGINDNQEITYTSLPVQLVGTLVVSENTDNITVDDLTVTWYDSSDNVITRPINAGAYKVVYSYDNDNYSGLLERHFTITKKTSKMPPEASIRQYGEVGKDLSTVALTTIGLSWQDGSVKILSGTNTYRAIYLENNDLINYIPREVDIIVYGRKRVNIETRVEGTGGSVSESISGILEDEKTTVTFTPDVGYEIDIVTLDGIEQRVTNNTLEVTARNNDSLLIVKYKKIQYTITVKASNAQVDIKTKQMVDYGSTQAIRITPDFGYRLISVLVDNEESINKLENGVLTLNNILSNKQIEIIATRITYNVVDGKDQTYTVGSSTSATFKIDASYELFNTNGKVYVDDNIVEEKNYTSKEGSTIITFNKAYMDTLKDGTHNLTVVFNNGGEAKATFKVVNTGNRIINPITMDTIKQYLKIFILSILAVLIVMFYRKQIRATE